MQQKSNTGVRRNHGRYVQQTLTYNETDDNFEFKTVWL
jgi:hypothetical protein